MSAYHHTHPHRHGARGVHEHRHGHRGLAPSRRGQPVPWPHWFAEHAHVHVWEDAEASLQLPAQPGEEAKP